MASAQPALRSIEPHTHPITETCPLCEQPIPNEKAKVIRARAAEMEQRLAADADRRAAQKFATEKAEIEKATKGRVERAEKEKAEAIKKLNAETAAKIEFAKAEGEKAAKAGLLPLLAAAEKAKTEAEKSAKTQRGEAQKRIQAANAKLKQVESDRDRIVEARVREVRQAMEKDKAKALAEKDAASDKKTKKLLAEVDTLKRQLEERRANELGEGAHIELLDALKAEFAGDGDDIKRIKPGVSGADILHKIMRNGIVCGSILYESKNSTQWRDEYVPKLIRDQTAAHADHAILATFKFPRDTAQVEIRDGVIIVNPARAVAMAQIIRRHLLHVHTLRLSKNERQEKMAGLYDFLTSERYALLMGRVDTESDALLDLQEKDKNYHDNHWKKEGVLIRSIQKAKAEIDTAVELIIGASASQNP